MLYLNQTAEQKIIMNLDCLEDIDLRIIPAYVIAKYIIET